MTTLFYSFTKHLINFFHSGLRREITTQATPTVFERILPCITDSGI